jgi:hypothetical protein
MKKKRMPFHKVEVANHGKNDGAYKGKNEWDNAIMKGLVTQCLNMTIVKFSMTKTPWTWLNSVISLKHNLNILAMS